MVGKKLTELPYYERPDLTPYLIHLTKASNDQTAIENLISILKNGLIEGTDGYVQQAAFGKVAKVACFMDVPFAALNMSVPRRTPDGMNLTVSSCRKKSSTNKGGVQSYTSHEKSLTN
jgi:hypothetical protein